MPEHTKRFDVIHAIATPVIVLIVGTWGCAQLVRELWQEVAHG